MPVGFSKKHLNNDRLRNKAFWKKQKISIKTICKFLPFLSIRILLFSSFICLRRSNQEFLQILNKYFTKKVSAKTLCSLIKSKNN